MMAVMIATILLAAMMTVSSAAAQQPASPWDRPDGAFFALSVADAEASALWYQKHLGFHVISRGEAPNGIAKGVLLEGRGSLLEIVQHSKARPLAAVLPQAAGAHEVHGIFKIGFHVRDLDAAYREMKTTGATIAYDLAFAREMGLRSFTVRDNEGNMVQFFGK